MYAIQSTEPTDIFEMMINDEPVEYITTQINLYFKQNTSGKIFKPTSRVMRHLIKSDGELCNSIDIRLYIASLLYRAIIHKPIADMYYTQDRLFETPEFKRILPQKSLVLIESYVQFVDIAELCDTYSRYAKIEPIHSYLVEPWQSLLTLECEASVDKALLLWKGRLSWKEYIKTKQARFGMKTFVLAEASSGYIRNSIIYTGDDTLIDEGNRY